jgi:short subunit dehydrogenase-like uncharacterized protein
MRDYSINDMLMAAVGLALAEGRLGAGRAGVLSPGAAFGPEAMPMLADAGVTWTLEND